MGIEGMEWGLLRRSYALVASMCCSEVRIFGFVSDVGFQVKRQVSLTP